MLETYCMRDGTCGWGAVLHTITRQEMHVALAPAITLAAIAAYVLLAFRWNVLPRWDGSAFYIVPCLFAVFLIGFREAYDAAAGDSPIKSTIDVGVAAALQVGTCWLLNFLCPFLHNVRSTMLNRRLNRRRRRRGR